MCKGENLNKKGEILKTAQTKKKCATDFCTKKNQVCKASKKSEKCDVYPSKKIVEILFFLILKSKFALPSREGFLNKYLEKENKAKIGENLNNHSFFGKKDNSHGFN